MKVFLKLKLFLILLLIPGITGLLAQDKDCAVKLSEAQEQFSLGQIEEVPGLLVNCIKSGFTREERIQAFKLLINSYIFDDNMALAEQYMLDFLKRYPEYEIVATDPSEFVDLYREFDNEPRFSVGVYGGLNLSNVRSFETFGVGSLTGIEDGLNGNGEYKSSGFGYQVGVSYNLNLGSGFEIGIEPMIIQNTYEFESRPFDWAYIEYSEDQLRVDLPVSLIYTLNKENKTVPYFRLGVKTSYLLVAKSDSKRSYLGTSDFEDVTGSEQEIQDARMLNNYWGVFGGGLRYKIPGAYIFLDVRYNLGLANQVNSNSRNNGLDENVWLYYYLQDDFFLDDLSFSIGISKTFYRPRRK